MNPFALNEVFPFSNRDQDALDDSLSEDDLSTSHFSINLDSLSMIDHDHESDIFFPPSISSFEESNILEDNQNFSSTLPPQLVDLSYDMMFSC